MVPKEKHFTASALVVHENKVLLVYHKKLGVWIWPGGHIEKNEHPDAALIRELKEETGLRVEIVSNYDKSFSDKETDITSLHIPYMVLCELNGDHYHNDLVYLCTVKNGTIENITHNEEESNDIGFFDREEIRDLKMFDNFRKTLTKVFDSGDLRDV
jgi:ADP-ribose pyrophosphatase YjhB (NUDIX family)